jgi:hypothetical protein
MYQDFTAEQIAAGQKFCREHGCREDCPLFFWPECDDCDDCDGDDCRCKYEVEDDDIDRFLIDG